MNSAPLQGLVALVTGGSRGIGRACALALAQAGADIALGAAADSSALRETAAQIEQAGVRVKTLTGDLAQREAAAGLVPRVLEEFGSIYAVVNNAGITRDNLALRMSDAEWDAVIAVNLSATFVICRAALKPMLRQRSGRIINVSSIAGIIGNPGQANYSAAKAGIIGLTKSLAREIGSRGITVNAVAPGFIESDMTQALPEAVRQQAIPTIPLQRFGQADEVAAAVKFLALPEASYITGHVLQVDGGLGA